MFHYPLPARMKSSLLLLFSMLLTFTAFSAETPGAYVPPKPSADLAVIRQVWHDSKRDRDVPVKIYYPKEGVGRLPVIIFSHGLGGSREGYEYLGVHWAGCGYISVHLQHAGSDDAVWKGKEPAEITKALTAAAMNLQNAAERPRDVSFVIDRLTELDSDPGFPLKGRLDLQRIGVAGHSFGGFTSMAIAGQDFGTIRMGDSRVKAVIEMSTPVARPFQRGYAYTKITIPVFHMTGTRDDSPIGETKASERRIPFELMNAAETCLLVFKDGDHMVFSGRIRPDEVAAAQDAVFQRLICAGSTAFWDAWLKGDTAAHGWLMDGGFAHLLGNQGTFEKKIPAKPAAAE
jgi:predicted dienelactone hydrolase